jgi:hypothetical protein
MQQLGGCAIQSYQLELKRGWCPVLREGMWMTRMPYSAAGVQKVSEATQLRTSRSPCSVSTDSG